MRKTYRYTNADGVFETVHRVAYRHAFGEIPEGMVVHHTCGNKECQNPWHLVLLTREEHRSLHSTGNSWAVKAKVAQIHPEHGLIKIWDSAYDATKAGLGTNINKVCSGERDTANDCWWMEV